MYVYIIHAFTYECVLKIKCTSIVSWLFALNETSQQLGCCCCGLCSLWGIEITMILIMKEGSIKTYPLVLATRPCIDDPREIHTPCWCGNIFQEIILIRSQSIYSTVGDMSSLIIKEIFRRHALLQLAFPQGDTPVDMGDLIVPVKKDLRSQRIFPAYLSCQCSEFASGFNGLTHFDHVMSYSVINLGQHLFR